MPKPVTTEQVNARMDQFKPVVGTFLSDGGSFIAGTVTGKSNWPAKEGKRASWNVDVSVFGGTFRVSVSEKLYDSIGVGSYHMFQVSQRASGNVIYNTAIES